MNWILVLWIVGFLGLMAIPLYGLIHDFNKTIQEEQAKEFFR